MYTSEPSEANSAYGGVKLCENPTPSPITATIYYLSLIVFGTFGILSAVVGIIGDSMERSIGATYKVMKERALEKRQKAAAKYLENLDINSIVNPRLTMEALLILKRALSGKTLQGKTYLDAFVVRSTRYTPLWFYFHLSHIMSRISTTVLYEQIITFVILLTAVSSGLETVGTEYLSVTGRLNTFIQYSFTVDLCIRLVAEPFVWYFFNDGWNIFDFGIVAITYVPLPVSNLMFIRLLRLLRVLKLMRRFRTLQLILETVVSSVRPIIFIVGILYTWVIILSCFAVPVFGANDPVHFADFRAAFITFSQLMTLDGWGSVMYVNLFGCDAFTGTTPYICTSPESNFSAAAFFFPFSIATLCWVIVTMFIGLMTTSMGEALDRSIATRAMEHDIKKLRKQKKISKILITKLKLAFDFLDITSSGEIGHYEAIYAINHSGLEVNVDELIEGWEFDHFNEVSLNFGDFLELCLEVREMSIALRKQRQLKKMSLAPKTFEISNISNSDDSEEPRQQENKKNVTVVDDNQSVYSINSWFPVPLVENSNASNTVSSPARHDSNDPNDPIGFWSTLDFLGLVPTSAKKDQEESTAESSVTPPKENGTPSVTFKSIDSTSQTDMRSNVAVEARTPVRFNEETGSLLSVNSGISSISRRRYTKEEQLDMKAFLQQKLAEAQKPKKGIFSSLHHK